MDLRFHIADLREVRLMVNGGQSARGASTDTAISRVDESLHRPLRHPARRVGRVRTGIVAVMIATVGIKEMCIAQLIDLKSAAETNSTEQRRIPLCERCDQKKLLDHRDRRSTVIPQSGGVYSKVDEIEPITLDRGVRYISQIVAGAKRDVCQQEV